MQNPSIYPSVVCFIILMLCLNKFKTFLQQPDEPGVYYQTKKASVNKSFAIKVVLYLFLLFILTFSIISFINQSK